MTVATKTPAPSLHPTTVNPVGAVKLAAWLYKEHPTLFRQLLAKVQAAKLAAGKTASLTTNTDPVPVSLSGLDQGGNITSLSEYRAKRLGALGFSLSSVTSGLSSTLSSIGSSLDSASSSAISSAIGSGTGSSGGFWSTLGSDLSSAGSSVLSGVKDVGSYLTTGGGLSALSGLANDYFQTKAMNTQTQMATQQQQAILQAQMAAVAQGGVPAPITYTTNAMGQQVPVYASATGYQPVTSSYLNNLFSGSTNWLPWAIGGGLALIVVLKLL